MYKAKTHVASSVQTKTLEGISFVIRKRYMLKQIGREVKLIEPFKKKLQRL